LAPTVVREPVDENAPGPRLDAESR
jgi:hypothetical protein